jgi:hypothetical protein
MNSPWATRSRATAKMAAAKPPTILKPGEAAPGSQRRVLLPTSAPTPAPTSDSTPAQQKSATTDSTAPADKPAPANPPADQPAASAATNP